MIKAWWTAHVLMGRIYCGCGDTIVVLLLVGFVTIGSVVAFRRRQRNNLDAANAAQPKGSL